MSVVAVIPARLDSTRLPKKLLADLGGQPLLWRVVERVRRARLIDVVVVATDSEAIEQAMVELGVRVVRTGVHRCGTDRVAEAARGLSAELVVNVQGDEPFVDPNMLDQLVVTMRASGAWMGTACAPLVRTEDFLNPHVVKVVPDNHGNALIFSRAPVPWPRDVVLPKSGPMPEGVHAWRHIGVYAFRVEALQRFVELPEHPLEVQERLEQLRALAAGWAVRLVEVDRAPHGVDTADDLTLARSRFD